MYEEDSFRQITSFEKQIIHRVLSTISLEIIHNLDDLQYYLFISFNKKKVKNDYPMIFLLTDDQRNFLNLIPEKNVIHSIGLYFGFFKKDSFLLSLEGAEFLFKNGIISNFQQIFLNKKGEKSFLYSNNITKNMVEKYPQKLKKRDFLLVLNGLNEVIGISQSQCDHQRVKSLNPRDVVAINLSDKGSYLRKAQ